LYFGSGVASLGKGIHRGPGTTCQNQGASMLDRKPVGGSEGEEDKRIHQRWIMRAEADRGSKKKTDLFRRSPGGGKEGGRKKAKGGGGVKETEKPPLEPVVPKLVGTLVRTAQSFRFPLGEGGKKT